MKSRAIVTSFYFVLVTSVFLAGLAARAGVGERLSATDKPPALALHEYLFPKQGPLAHALKKGVRTDSVLVMHSGKIIYEEYANGFTPETRHQIWSAGKGIVNALVGIAVRDGLLSLSDSVCAYLTPPDALDGHCAITLNDLLHWSSGLEWNETYNSGNILALTVLSMLYGEGEGDMASFTLHRKLRGAPGGVWAYSSGDSNILMAVLKKVYGEEYDSMPWTKLFNPLGLGKVSWARDRAGTFVGSSYLFMTPRDLATFGGLFMNQGISGGTRILPPGWVDYSLTLAPAFPLPSHAIDEPDKVSGAHWWINSPVPERKLGMPWPDAPADAFAAIGFLGQYLFVIPSRELIVVRMGDDLDHSFDRNHFLKLVLDLAAPETPADPTQVPTPPPAPGPDSSVHDEAVANSGNAQAVSISATYHRYAAKEYCACHFVVGQSDSFCSSYVIVSGLLLNLKLDEEAGTVEATSLLGKRTRASFEGDPFGCVLME